MEQKSRRRNIYNMRASYKELSREGQRLEGL